MHIFIKKFLVLFYFVLCFIHCQSTFYTWKNSNANIWTKKKYKNSINGLFTYYQITPLMIAVFYKKLKYIKKMISNNSNININQQDLLGNTALHWAIYKNKNTIASFLLSHVKQKVSIKNEEGLDVLLYSIQSNNFDIFQKIESQYPKKIESTRDNENNNAIYYAIRYNRVDILQYILKKYPNIHNERNSEQNTIWNIAAKYANSNTIQILNQFANKSNIQDTNTENSNPVHIATFYQNVPNVQYFLQQNVNFNQISNIHDTPMLLVCKNGNTKIAQLLIKKAKMDTQKNLLKFLNPLKKDNKSCLYYVIANQNNGILKDLMQLEIDWTFLKEKPILWAFESNNQFAYSLFLSKESDNKTLAINELQSNKLLVWAIQNNSIKYLDILLKNKIKPNSINDLGENAVFFAMQKNKINMLEVLYKYKADINIQNNLGNTPLHEAINLGFERVTFWLITRGAKIDIKNKNQEIPYDIAKRMGYQNIANILQNINNSATINTN